MRATRKRKPPTDRELGQLATDIDLLRTRLDDTYLTPTLYRELIGERRRSRKIGETLKTGVLPEIKEKALGYLDALAYPHGYPDTSLEQLAKLRFSDERTELLTDICPTLAKLSTATREDVETHTRCLSSLGRQADRLRTVIGAAAPDEDDGPCEGHAFRLNGKIVAQSIRPAVWRTLNELWPIKPQGVDFADLAEPVYNDINHFIDQNVMSSIQRGVRELFEPLDVPWRLKTKKGKAWLFRQK